MTLPPNDESFLVVGVEGRSYKVGPRCANPFCARFAEHAHHLWRRSLLKGDYRWVLLPDGSIVGNLVALCADCHDRVTGRVGGHKNAIRLDLMTGRPIFYWTSVRGEPGELEYEYLRPINPQPPSPTSPDEAATEETDDCPTCGQSRRRRSRPERGTPTEGEVQRERRRRKTWMLRVPADDEDGAAVLDALVEALAPVVGVEPDTGGRYYIVVAAMAHANSDIPALTASLAGRGA
jgi:hypothetical protein